MTDTVSQLTAALSDRYVVERLIGEGGMATVYLARDARHNRKVALKVLKPDLGAIVGVERFLSEIQVTANLQHPNLLPLFDSGQVDGLLFYVMPYIEGESLRARLEREKQLSVDDAVRIAASVASALDYAHRHGVIHRDLKPENILLHDGQPLVADFGIALAVSNAGGNRITQTGLSLGTPQYMSPEQATGDRVIDARSDIYSLGAVTYEMLTGEAPHTGATSQAIIARVLTERPRSIRSSRPSVPPHVEATIEHALEKLAPDRFATAKEFADGLTGKVVLTTVTTQAHAAVGQSHGLTQRERLFAAAFGLALIAAVVLGFKTKRSEGTRDAPPDVRFTFETPQSPGPAQVVVSPDGRFIIFSGPDEKDRPILWLRALDSPDAVPLKGTDESFTASWSPDSRQIAFSANGKLKRMAIPGGTAMTVAEAAQINGVAWIGDSALVFVGDRELRRVRTSGGVVVKVPVEGLAGAALQALTSLSDGKHVLSIARGVTGAGPFGLYAVPLSGGTAVRLSDVQGRVSFSEPDQVLFIIDETLYSQRLNLKTLTLEGDPVRVAESVLQNTGNGATGFGNSNNGVLAYRPARSQNMRQLRWFLRSGQSLDTLGPQLLMNETRLSPDGRRVAVTAVTTTGRQARGVWIVDLSSRISSRITSDTVDVSSFSWSADSRALYLGGRAAPMSIWRRTLGSTTDSVVYRPPAGIGYAEDAAADGSALLVMQSDSLMILRLDGSSARTIHRTPRSFDEPRISPDGKLIAYQARESDEIHVFVADFPGLGNRRQISATNGRQPLWKGDSRELYFLDAAGKVMMALRKPGAAGEFNAPVMLFQSPIPLPSRGSGEWDVTRDGQRFVFVAPLIGESARAPTITVVHDWRKVLPQR